jgi:hypothetical protein
MDNPPQLVQQILFSLDRLADGNGHHEYEKICFAFARRRVSINLLPATGPVSAGGDQGRDGESFWSNIANEIPAISVHAATVSGERVVLACTIQKTDIPSKIRSDLSSITGRGTTVDRVLYFTVAPVPVAKRHELIAQTRMDHDVKLEIFDGLALAEHLADPDLFWIAAEYLKLPASLAPERADEDDPLPDWYVRDRDYWRARTDPGRTMGDLVSLKDVLRHATYHDEARGDLGDWIAKMREFLTGDGPADVLMRARYEIAVATLRGTGELHAADPLVRDFFEMITHTEEDLPLLEDASVLLQYGYGSRLRGNTSITMPELDNFYETLRAHVQTALAAGPYPNAKALLLAIDVRLAFFQTYPNDLPERVDGLRDPRDTLRLVLDAYDADETVPAQTSAFPLRDRDRGMATLASLLDGLSSAPLFPIEHTAELFEILTLSVADHPEYAELRDGLDEAVARVGGDATKAERARARAITFAGAGQLLRALAEVHEAKIGWRHGETIEDSIPMMLLAASIYEHLGLFFAAKLHAFAAAVAANGAQQTDVRRFVPRSVAVAAINDFKAGNWCSASRLVRVTLLAQNMYAEDPTSLDRHAYLADVLQREAFALHVAHSLAPDYEPAIRAAAQDMGTETLLNDMASQLVNDDHWTIETLARGLDRQGFGRPFADAGQTRDIRWTAFGAVWSVRSRNTRRDTLAAERLISGIQIIQAELALADAVWLPAEIHIEVITDRDERPTDAENLERIPDNDLSRWIVHLKPGDSVQEDRALVDIVTDASLLLLDNSLLDREKFLALIDDAFARGLGHKLSGGRPYDEAADFLRDEDYECMSALPNGPLGEGTVRDASPEQPELAPRTDLSEWYDHDETVANIERRYQRMMPIGRMTIPRLARTEPTATVLYQLRSEGWRDWQLIMAITNIIGNARPDWEGLRLAVDSPPKIRLRASALLRREELDTDPQLDSEAFTRDKLLAALRFTALLTLPSYGLHLNTPSPNATAVLTVLRDRFNFGVDDTQHDDLLAPSPNNGQAY